MKRDRKGQSITDFPTSYVVLEMITTGADPYCDSILAVRAKRYLGATEVASFSEKIKTEEYIQEGKPLRTVLLQLKNFIGDMPLIGYQISFLMNYLYERYENMLGEPFTNDYLDLKEVIRTLKGCPGNYSLSHVCKVLKIDGTKGDHEFVVVSKIASLYQKVRNNLASEAQERLREIQRNSPFHNSLCVFTGKLQRMERKEAVELLGKVGGRCAERVTMKTNYLILGNHDYYSKITSGKSNKQRRAEELKEKGNDLEVISENVYYSMIGAKPLGEE